MDASSKTSECASGDKAPSNNGWVVDGYDPVAHFADEAAPRGTLRNLGRLVPGAVDWALLDGNHDGDYLRADLAALAGLVRPGGLVLLDDCTSAWPAIKRTFTETATASEHWTAIGSDGRVGVLKRTTDGAG